MCGGPSAPTPPPVAPEAPIAPSPSSGESASARDERRRRTASGGADRSTILTSARGVQDGAATAQKTLLGQ